MRASHWERGNTVYRSPEKLVEWDNPKRSGSSVLTLRIKEKSAELWNKGKNALCLNPRAGKSANFARHLDDLHPEDCSFGSNFAGEKTLTSALGCEGSSAVRPSCKSRSGTHGAISSSDARLLPPLSNPHSRAAAKASVAAQIRKGHNLPQPRLQAIESQCRDPAHPLTPTKLGQSLTKDTESGVDLHQGNRGSKEADVPVIRMGKFTRTSR